MNFKIAASPSAPRNDGELLVGTQAKPPCNDGEGTPPRNDGEGLFACNKDAGANEKHVFASEAKQSRTSRIAASVASLPPRNDGELLVGTQAKPPCNDRFLKRTLLLFTLCIFVLLFVCIRVSFCAPDSKPKGEWTEHKSDHFIIYHHPDIPNKYIRELARKSEKYYDRITRRLGFNRFNFWLWENRATMLVYKDAKEYVEETASPIWAGAAVHAKEKYIATYYYPPGNNSGVISGLPTKEMFLDSVLPHEMTHIIFKEFIGFNTPIPLWLDEGIACANEKNGYDKYLFYAKNLLREARAVSVSKLTSMSHADNLPEVFYPMSAALVIFLLEERGKRSDFVEFCRELRDGTELYEAIRKVYRIKDVEELNEKFMKFLRGST